MSTPTRADQGTARGDTAADHLSDRIPTAGPDEPVGDIRDRMVSSPRFDSVSDIAVLDGARLVGLIRIEDLLAGSADTPAREIMDPDPPIVAPGEDQETAAWKAVAHGETTLAVVDGRGVFLGVIPPSRLLGVLLREHEEDMARHGGYLRQGEAAREHAAESFPRRFWHRLPWLLVGLVAAMVAAAMVSGFETRLEADLALAFFIPGIVYIADAVGTQTETLIVRGLSLGIPVRAVAVRELATGVAIGTVVAVTALPLSLLLADLQVALTVSVAVFASSSIATAVAMAVPYMFSQLGSDPAFGSGPLATVIQDLLSLLVYFGTAMLILGG